MLAVELEKVSKTYRGQQGDTVAMSDYSLAVRAGEFVAVMGASGCGKSTLLNILGTLDSYDSGTYRLFTKKLNGASQKELTFVRANIIGFIFQSYNLISSLNSIENVALPLKYRGINRTDREKMSKNALVKVGLEEKMRSLPTQLSGGQQQRVAIARAIATRPPLLLADEPTGNLDSEYASEILNIISEINRKGTTVIMITHDKQIASRANYVERLN